MILREAALIKRKFARRSRVNESPDFRKRERQAFDDSVPFSDVSPYTRPEDDTFYAGGLSGAEQITWEVGDRLPEDYILNFEEDDDTKLRRIVIEAYEEGEIDDLTPEDYALVTEGLEWYLIERLTGEVLKTGWIDGSEFLSY